MAKPKQQSSAAQRREQTRQQRQQRLNPGQNTRNQGRNRRKQSSNRGTWLFIGGILVMVVVVIGIFVFLSNLSKTQSEQTSVSDANSALNTISSLSPTVFSTVGKGSSNALQLMKAVPANANVPTVNGKPQVLYVGGDFCPYCGGQRWALITALSRFGKFEGVKTNVSGEGSVPTFTFDASSYTSEYITFTGVETSNNQGQSIATPTPEQQKLLDVYNAPPYTNQKGTIPFVMIANQTVSTGSYVNSTDLIGHTHQDIVNQLSNPSSSISKDIVGSANYITAAICKATNNQPESVCKSEPIPSLQAELPKPTTSFTGTTVFASVADTNALALRRRESGF